MRRMAHDEINQDWLNVSLRIDHLSISLTIFVHLTGRYFHLRVCAKLVKKIDVDRRKKTEKRTDKSQRCITHYVVDLLFFIFIFLFISTFLFPRFFLSLSPSHFICVAIHEARRKNLPLLLFLLLPSTMLMIVGGW